MNNEKELRFIEMFCGVGGFRLGLEKAGNFKCIWANDNDKNACKIYRKRFGDKELIEKDVRKISTKSIPDHDLLTGGFPCQAFSQGNPKRKGMSGEDTRGTLFHEIWRVARDKKPQLLLLENVPGLLSSRSGKDFQTILSSLDELGYNIEWCCLNSLNFGIPQIRQRVFIFGNLRNSKSNACQKSFKATPILCGIATRFRNTAYNWTEIGRSSSQIIREDAGISVELDGRITKNGKKVFDGKCSERSRD